MMVRRTTASSAALIDAAWAHALTIPVFGYSEISTGLKITHDRATDIVQGWVAAKLLEEVAPGTTKRKLWRIKTGAVRPARPSGRTPQQNMWTAMRHLGAFMPSAVAHNATVEPVQVSLEEAQAYCRALLAAGYLRVTRKAAPPHIEAIYKLIRNTGPKPPVERRLRAVVDDNTDAVHLIGGPGQ